MTKMVRNNENWLTFATILVILSLYAFFCNKGEKNMKENIPFDEFYDYYKEDSVIPRSIEEQRLQVQKQDQWLERMKGVSWEDLANLSPEEMIQVPICWIYDWTHVTANYNLQEKVNWLYERYKLPILTLKEYLNYFNRKR